MKKQRLIYNNDGTDILHNKRHGGRPLTPGDVEDYVDAVADTQVTSFFFYTTDDRVEGVTGEGPSRCLLTELGSSETLRARNKLYALSGGMDEFGHVYKAPLPAPISSQQGQGRLSF